MANPEKGEMRFTALGKSWTFLFDFNCVSDLEAQFDLPFVAIVGSIFPDVPNDDLTDPAKLHAAARDAAAQMRFGNIRAVIRAGLEEFHPGVTERDAGKIVDALGIKRALMMVRQAVAAAISDDSEDTETPVNPPERVRKRARRKG